MLNFCSKTNVKRKWVFSSFQEEVEILTTTGDNLEAFADERQAQARKARQVLLFHGRTKLILHFRFSISLIFSGLQNKNFV